MREKSKNRQPKTPWKQFCGKVQESWEGVSGDDLDEFEGKKDRMIKHIQKKTGEPRKDIQTRLEKLKRDSEYSFGNGQKNEKKEKGQMEGTVSILEKTKGRITFSFVSGMALGSIVGLGTGYALFRSDLTNGRKKKDPPEGQKREKKHDESEHRNFEESKYQRRKAPN